MDKRKNPHELLWDLIRKNDNNKTQAAKALGISRQLLNYYVNQAQQLSDEFIRKIKIALGKEVASSAHFLQKTLAAIENHPLLLLAEKETKLSIRATVKEILCSTFNEHIRNE